MYSMGLRRRALRCAIERLKGDLQDIHYGHIQILLEAVRPDQAGGIIHLPGGILAERSRELLIIHKGDIAPYDREVQVPGRTEIPEIDPESDRRPLARRPYTGPWSPHR